MIVYFNETNNITKKYNLPSKTKTKKYNLNSFFLMTLTTIFILKKLFKSII